MLANTKKANKVIEEILREWRSTRWKKLIVKLAPTDNNKLKPALIVTKNKVKKKMKTI